MKVHNDDEENPDNDFKQLHDFIPDRCFRILNCGPSSSGKRNVLLNRILELLYFVNR